MPSTILGMFSSGARSNAEQAKLPGYREYEAANQYIGRPSTTEGNGNTETAKLAGAACAHMMQAWIDSASSDSPKNVTAWCELHPNRVLFLVRVPDFRKYNNEAKDEICQAAWYAAQIAARELELTSDAEIAVAVRGLALYDRMMTGNFVPASGDDDEDIEVTLEGTIRQTDRRVTGGEKFAGYFIAPEG